MNKPSIAEILHDARGSFSYALDRVISRFVKQAAQVLKAKGLSQRDLAAGIGCSAPHVSKIFSGNPNLTVASMLKIANALGCDLQVELREKVEQQSKTTTITNFSGDAGKTNAFSTRLVAVEFSNTSTETLQQHILNPDTNFDRECSLAA